MPPEAAELRRWVEKAQHDVDTAELALGFARPITDTAAFHCQQAVEKLLKAYLISHDHEFEKIHDLRALLLECAKFDRSFREFLDRVGPLTAYAVRFRYPGPNDPTVDEVRWALSVVRKVQTFVLGLLPLEARGE